MSPNALPLTDSRCIDKGNSLGERIVEGAIQLAWLDGLTEAEICKQMRVPRKHISELTSNRLKVGSQDHSGHVDA